MSAPQDSDRFDELVQWASGNMNQAAHNVERISVVVDRDRFIQTRNALTNAFVGLSGAIDEAVKAYVNHTNAVLDGVGGSSLDVSGLLQPFSALNGLNVAQLAQQAMQQQQMINGGFPMTPAGVPLNPDGTKKKRQYKPRDKNAPKRPLTAYFRYLQQQRPLIQAEIARAGPSAEGGKAGDISKIATERWNALPKEQQEPYRKAYEEEMDQYYAETKAYKAAGAQEEGHEAPAEADTAAAGASPDKEEEASNNNNDDSDSDESSSSEEESEEEEEEEEVVAPPPPPPAPKPKSSSPDATKKTPKSALKKSKAGANAVAPAEQFQAINPEPVLPAPVAPMTSSSPTRKRKADDTTDAGESKKKKGGRKSKADQQAEDAAAAASQLTVPEPSQPDTPAEKPKKEKKKKRKSEAAAA